MLEESSLDQLNSIELGLTDRLKDPEFRREWFRAELEEAVPASFHALRERRNQTQTALAEQMGTKQPAISRFEKSTEAVWEFEFLLRMAEALDARLRVVVEAAEDIISDYDAAPPESIPGASVLGKLTMVVSQSQLSPFDLQINTNIISAANPRIPDETDKHRASENRSASRVPVHQGQPIPFRLAG